MLKPFLKDIALYAPSKLLPAFTTFITTPILTRLFPPAEYGYWAIASSISMFLAALSVDGYGSAVLRFFPAYKEKSALNVFLGTLGVSVGTIIAFVSGLSILMIFLFKRFIPSTLYPLLPFVILIFIGQSFSTVFLSVIRAQGRSGSFTSFQLFANYGGLLIGLLMVVFLGLRINGLLLGNVLALFLVLPLLVVSATKEASLNLRFFNRTEAIKMWSFAWPLAIGNVAMWGLRVSDLFIINIFRSEREVGLYSVSYNLSSRSIELLVALFLLSVSPLIFKTWESEGRESTEKALTMVTRVYLIFCLPAAVGLVVLAFPFVALLTTPDYYEGYKIVGFIVFSSFAWGLANIAMMGLAIKKKAGRLGANQIMAALVHIVLQLFLVPRFGYFASAISTLIGYTILLILQATASRPYLKWHFPFKTLRHTFISSVFMGLVAWAIYGISAKGSKILPFSLILSISVATLLYFISLWALGEVKDEEKVAALQFWHKLIHRDS